MMDYEQSLVYLARLGKFGINLGLARIETLLKLLGNPEKKFKSVHITGTNGKGSTTAMVASILQQAGLKTGMYTSPHLTDYTERIMIDGQQISRQDFAAAIRYVGGQVEKMVREGGEHPTEFEILTAAAFYHFALMQVEYAVIEVGLGGLLDSTNVIFPELSVITNVTLEHTDRCGHTVEEIAVHKAGIIKQGIPVVTAAQGEALTVIKAAAQHNDAPLYIWNRDIYGELAEVEAGRQNVAVQIPAMSVDGKFSLQLLGTHQAVNCSLAVAAAALLKKRDHRITAASVRKGLAMVKWPGRFEVLEGAPVVIIDGAHNPDGMRVLRENLDLWYRNKCRIFLLGILKDKDVAGMVRQLIRAKDMVVAVAPASDRAADPETVAKEIRALHVETAPSIEEGLQRCRMLAGEDAVICVAGSLYLIGRARQLIFSRQKETGWL
jgi:dihydrofolate synthase/folylpolyglutamate synthase